MPQPRRTALAGVVAVAAVVLSACGGSSRPAGATSTTASPAAAQQKPPAHKRPTPTCPLTGRPTGAGEKIGRAPLAVKIDNVGDALPQAGLNSADVVFEELVEGGLTRLMAVFQCDQAASVGPIRSARISDADLLALLHGSVLGYSGANPADLPPIQAHGDAVLISNDALGQYFHRDYSRPAPHNVFSSTATLLAAGLSRRHGLGAPKPLFRYGALSSSGRPAHRVSMSWPAASASWTWSGGRYLRVQNGAADHVVGGPQVSATDVVVMSVHIASTGLRDVLGNASPLDVTVGHGKVWVFRDGRVVTGTWKRPKVTSHLSLVGHHGKPLRLSPGRTWVELLPSGSTPRLG